MAKNILLGVNKAEERKSQSRVAKNSAAAKMGKAADSFKGAKPAFDGPQFQRKEEKDWGRVRTFSG